MSLISKILNAYTNEAGKPEINFIDDLGNEYRLEYELSNVLNYFDGHPSGDLSELEERELEVYLRDGLRGKINQDFAIFVNASFMEWRDRLRARVGELESCLGEFVGLHDRMIENQLISPAVGAPIKSKAKSILQ